jgi:polar amino acid transport system substrate-binding protein
VSIHHPRPRPRRHRARIVATAAVGLSLAVGAAACGGSSTNAGGGSSAAADPALARQLPADIRSGGVVKVGTDATFPPFESMGADGRTVEGFDADLAKALGAKLGVDFQFNQLSFDGLIPALKGDRFNLIMAGMADTRERQAQVNFINYFRSGLGILVKKGNPEAITKLSDLCGKTVALQKGTAQVDLVRRQSATCPTPISIKIFPAETDAQLQVRTGRAVADVTDFPVAVYTARTAGGGSQFEVAKSPRYATTLYGIAVPKGRPALQKAIRAALQSLIADGTYRRTLEKWGLGALAIDKVTINGATS